MNIKYLETKLKQEDKALILANSSLKSLNYLYFYRVFIIFILLINKVYYLLSILLNK